MNSYILLKVEGRNINKFLLKCESNNINIIKIIYKSYKSVIILINENDYKKILKIKSINKITIIKSLGLRRYKELINKYIILLISFFIGILLLIILSNIIFEINIIGDNNTLNNEIKKELSNYGIEKYKFKKNYNQITSIKTKLKKKYKDNIEWIEIKENGTKYIINYVERKKKEEKIDNEIYSIVSKKSGIIKDIYTYKGISLIEPGNYVSKGEILISSDIMLNDEVKYRESAEGKVYAETWYKVNIEYPFNYKEKKYTNKTKIVPYIKIGNRYIELFKYKHYDRKKSIYYKNKMIGFEIGLERIRSIIITNKKYSNKEAIKKAESYSKEKILDKLKEDEYIIKQKTLNFYSNGSKIIVDIFFSVYEEIGEKRIIETGEVDDTENIGERTN